MTRDTRHHDTRHPSAFTLIGLLLPALAKSRGAAKDTMCLAQLKQVSLAWQTYALENEGYNVPAWHSTGGVGWWTFLGPYIQNILEYIECPSTNAAETGTAAVMQQSYGTATRGWGSLAIPPRNYGYGMNNWLERSGGPIAGYHIPKVEDDARMSYVPAMGDCVWGDGGWPQESDNMPSDFKDPMSVSAEWAEYMRRFAIARHGSGSHMAFLDGSARHLDVVGGELKKLTWHGRWGLDVRPTRPGGGRGRP